MSKAETRGRAPHRRLGILAGGGSMPREIAESAVARGVRVHIVAIAGEADDTFADFPHIVAGWGQIGGMIAAFRKAGITDLLFVGRVRRPDLKRLRPDLGFIMGLPEIVRLVLGRGGDDGVLRGVIRFFERRGFRVVGPAAVAPELLVGSGAFGKLVPSSADEADIALGLDVVASLGPFDIGQGVVVAGGRLLAVEAAENTDGMLQRVSRLRREAGTAAPPQAGVLVKRPKPGQDLRIDLPAVGPRTVIEAAEAGLAGIAVMAGAVVAADRSELVARLASARVFLVGVPIEGDEAAIPRSASSARTACGRLAGARPSEGQAADAAKGGRVHGALRRYGAGEAVVVARGYVLAVEAGGEGAAAAITRAGALRQWGAARTRKRSGVAVVASPLLLTPEVLAAADAALLSGIAVVTQPGELKADGARIGAQALAATTRGISIWTIPDESDPASVALGSGRSENEETAE